MSNLKVSKIALGEAAFSYSSLQKALENLPWNPIATVNWPDEYPYQPAVDFQIAHAGDRLFLHYRVAEDFVRANYIRPNEAVWEDSCVEFFLSLDDRKTYFNFEFNVLGTGLIGYGGAIKSSRKRLAPATIEMVSTATSVLNIDGKKTWNIVLAIPAAIFAEQGLTSFDACQAHANFYKCGDALPVPHFISWAPIDHPSPNFHLPEYFGALTFE